MAKSKVNPNAVKLVDDYIQNSPEFARPICSKLKHYSNSSIKSSILSALSSSLVMND